MYTSHPIIVLYFDVVDFFFVPLASHAPAVWPAALQLLTFRVDLFSVRFPVVRRLIKRHREIEEPGFLHTSTVQISSTQPTKRQIIRLSRQEGGLLFAFCCCV